MKQVLFFATPVDIVPVLERLQSNAPLKFVEIGTLQTPDRAVYLDARDIPDPGIATHETGSLSKGFLVSRRDAKINIRPSVTRDGEARWNAFNADSEGTAVLGMGGVWTTGTLLPGSIATVHADSDAQAIVKWLLSALKAEGFSKIREWWVGSEALRMLISGARLTTTAEQSPPEFDLKLPTNFRMPGANAVV